MADHQVVERVLGHLEPLHLLVAIRLPGVVDLLEPRIRRRDLVIELASRLERCVHDLAREAAELRPRPDQAAQRRPVLRIVFGGHPVVRIAARCLEDGLVLGGQAVPLLNIDVGRQLGAAFPPARVVIELRDLREAELLVVIRTDPLRRVDRALFERRVDVAARDLLRDHAELAEDHAAEPGDPELETLEVLDRLDLLAEPAAHLRAGVAGRDRVDVVVLEEVRQQLAAAAEGLPRRLLARVEAERNGAVEAEGRVLADVVVARRMAELDRAGLDGIENLQARHQLARREDADLEFAAGRVGHSLGQDLRGPVQGVETLREAGRKAPADLRRLGNGGSGQRTGRRGTQTGGRQKFTSLHMGTSPKAVLVIGPEPGRIAGGDRRYSQSRRREPCSGRNPAARRATEQSPRAPAVQYNRKPFGGNKPAWPRVPTQLAGALSFLSLSLKPTGHPPPILKTRIAANPPCL